MKKLITLIALTITTLAFSSCGNNTVHKAEEQKTTKKSPRQALADTLVFKDPELAELVRHTDQLLDTLYGLIPFSNTMHLITQMGLSEADLKFMAENNREDFSTTEPMDRATVNLLFVDRIEDNLMTILKWKNIDDYDLRLLLKGQINVISSPDGRLLNFAFDENTGGSYKSSRYMSHYRDGKGRSYNSFDTVSAAGLFSIEGCYEIDTIHTRDGIKYLMLGQYWGCSSCISTSVGLLSFKDEQFKCDMTHSVSTRAGGVEEDDNIIVYDAVHHLINIKYQTSDLNENCVCYAGDGKETEETDTLKQTSPIPPEGTVCQCRYVFNGSTFVLK